MNLESKQPELIKEIQEGLQGVKTVGDLLEYLRLFRSPIIGDLLRPAVAYFMTQCSGPRKWSMIKDRKHMGLKFQLTPKHELDATICKALRSWLLYYGRDRGTDLESNRLSAQLGVKDPRAVAFDILVMLENFAEPGRNPSSLRRTSQAK